jgi:hypothetical protein
MHVTLLRRSKSNLRLSPMFTGRFAWVGWDRKTLKKDFKNIIQENFRLNVGFCHDINIHNQKGEKACFQTSFLTFSFLVFLTCLRLSVNSK